ncbi:acyl-coenzyme A diphosphatase NUDT19-like isoform X1 [Macrobrachium nipponense]|uniref:acyl-coenzyme A diphosphatase NUDT19-like isoform X1 n=2 Tax=Macrobrachium nipponense TaxID=159736 RepID=UPI0030C8BB12
MSGKFWREAASLIIVGRNGVSNKVSSIKQDYQLLFLKRSNKSSFMPGAFVFPGGATDASDFVLDWLDVFKNCGHTKEDLVRQFRNSAPLPEFYANKTPDILLPEVGFRIAALRETFEESEVLLSSYISKDSYKQIDLKKWSKAVRDDPAQFLALFDEFGGCPAIWNLHEWSGWLTPSTLKKRFDTAFYIAFVDEISKPAADGGEISDIQVASPKSILEQWQNGSILLPPPQAYEISRFLQFRHYDKLKEFAINRGKMGLDRWCPVKVLATDGFISVLPGKRFILNNCCGKKSSLT